MRLLSLLLISLFGITVVSGFIVGGYGGGRSYSSSSSSEEHGHGHRPPRPRPPHRPRPPSPPPQRDPECEDGWMSFNRTAGRWCVKVFYGGGLAQYNAEELCQGQGATLTGLQTINERVQLANAGRLISNANGGGLAEIWLGATRRAGCNRRTDCTPLNTFQWTDGHTTGTAGMFWPGPEPNSVWFTNWGNQNCLELQVSAADGVAARHGYPHASLDDEHCQKDQARLYACGKLAK
ncbi:hypothetical protein B9Z55_003639 [Caenorhabditis nigoni]|uniref:C-type lectin domain-containing protein n=1 Tax=Caenorhabditis nigoni TaxID=1611254 RepID=A0A2G5VRU9_9PELO|nr:hypothetical protein B9Z55_003639 [Caenorhabditis nigoni]